MDSDEEYYLDEEDEDADQASVYSEDDEDLPMEDYGGGATASCSTRQDEFTFEVLSADQIVHFMVDCIKEVNAVVQIPATTTRILLNHFRWDKEKLMERYYDGDQDKLFSEAHVVSPHRREANPKVATRRSGRTAGPEEEQLCEICFLSSPPSEMKGLECGHRFCQQCWGDYLRAKIMEEGMGQTIACPAYGCDILVDDQTVMELIKDVRVRLKYQQIITNSFVGCNKLLRWCPAP